MGSDTSRITERVDKKLQPQTLGQCPPPPEKRALNYNQGHLQGPSPGLSLHLKADTILGGGGNPYFPCLCLKPVPA